jgi:hypothetical protein
MTIEQEIKKIRKTAFNVDYRPTEAQILGLWLARHFNWDGLEILKTYYEALEDSNFHEENKTIDQLIKKMID